MEASCLSCHGADVQLAKLDLRTRESAIRGGDHGTALVPGNADQSKLFRMISGPGRAGHADGARSAHAAPDRRVSRLDQSGCAVGDARSPLRGTFSPSWSGRAGPVMARRCSCRSSICERVNRRCVAARMARPLVPGNAEQSRLYRAVAHLDAIKMPMQGEKLKPEEIAAVKTWIDQGAQWEAAATASASAEKPASSALAALETMTITPEQRNYWAFKLPVQAPPPMVANRDLTQSDRSLPRERARRTQPEGRAASRQVHARAPRVSGSAGPASDPRSSGGVRLR